MDYGAAHAAKYGHERYGKTYEGVYEDWQPGQKVHLVGHSMGGQTIRQLESLLEMVIRRTRISTCTWWRYFTFISRSKR